MMGSTPTRGTDVPSSIRDARAIAQRWLGTSEPGVEAESGGDAFPGYYTFETRRNGRVDGMISVNARTGALWAHWWHGTFVRER